MSYNSSIPVGTDAMVQSQKQIYTNFNVMNTVWTQNHVNLTALDNQGMHNSLTFRIQTGDPSTSATQVALYTKAVGGLPNLFFRPNSSQTPIQLTYPAIQTGLQTITPPVYYPQQYTFLAGPFVVYMGVLTGVTAGSPYTLSPTSTLLYAQATSVPFYDPAFPTLQRNIPIFPSVSGSIMTLNFSNPPTGPATLTIYYFAIGQ